MYTESAFEMLVPNSLPEVRRVSLATVTLRLLAMGVKDIPGFPFLEPPTRQALAKALELLFNLGAIAPTCVPVGPARLRVRSLLP